MLPKCIASDFKRGCFTNSYHASSVSLTFSHSLSSTPDLPRTSDLIHRLFIKCSSIRCIWVWNVAHRSRSSSQLTLTILGPPMDSSCTPLQKFEWPFFCCTSYPTSEDRARGMHFIQPMWMFCAWCYSFEYNCWKGWMRQRQQHPRCSDILKLLGNSYAEYSFLLSQFVGHFPRNRSTFKRASKCWLNQPKGRLDNEELFITRDLGCSPPRKTSLHKSSC